MSAAGLIGLMAAFRSFLQQSLDAEPQGRRDQPGLRSAVCLAFRVSVAGAGRGQSWPFPKPNYLGLHSCWFRIPGSRQWASPGAPPPASWGPRFYPPLVVWTSRGDVRLGSCTCASRLWCCAGLTPILIPQDPGRGDVAPILSSCWQARSFSHAAIPPAAMLRTMETRLTASACVARLGHRFRGGTRVIPLLVLLIPCSYWGSTARS